MMESKEARVAAAVRALFEEYPRGIENPHKLLAKQLDLAPQEVLIILQRLQRHGRGPKFVLEQLMYVVNLYPSEEVAKARRLSIQPGMRRVTLPSGRSNVQEVDASDEKDTPPSLPVVTASAELDGLRRKYDQLRGDYRTLQRSLRQEYDAHETTKGQLAAAKQQVEEFQARLEELQANMKEQGSASNEGAVTDDQRALLERFNLLGE